VSKNNLNVYTMVGSELGQGELADVQYRSFGPLTWKELHANEIGRSDV
jgi:hypothetical protein